MTTYPTNVTDISNSSSGECNRPLTWALTWGMFGVPCSCVGVPANAWLLYILSQKRRGDAADVYYLNLLVANLIMSVDGGPAALVQLFVETDVNVDTAVNIVDNVVTFFFFLTMTCRMLVTACMCADCYMAVVHPISYMKIKDTRYKMVVSVVVWALSLSYSLVLVFEDYFVFTSLAAIPFILSMPVVVFCNLSVLRALRKPDPSGKTEVHPQKQRAMQTITNSFIETLVSYLPLMVLMLVSSAVPDSHRFCVILLATVPPYLGSSSLPVRQLHRMGHLKVFTRLMAALKSSA